MKITNLLLMIVCCLSMLFIPTQTKSQNYKTGIGLRLGWEYGLSVKHFFTEKMAIEGLVTSRFYGNYNPHISRNHSKHVTKHTPYSWGLSGRGVNFTGLLEWHFPIGNVKGLQWFIGGGIHIGFWEAEDDHYWFPTHRLPNGELKNVYALIGIDVIGGIQYTLAKAPITFQVDLKPSLHFAEWFGLWYDTLGITARYVFK